MSGNLKNRHVAVIGGGIGGLCAAIACARRGASIQVFEQAEVFGDVGAGIQVPPNAAAVFARLGLTAGLADIAVEPSHVALRDGHGGGVLATVPVTPRAGHRFGHGHFVVHRGRLAELLWQAADEAGIALKADARVTADELSDMDVVIAADGVKSETRRSRFNGGAATFAGKTAWRALVPLTGAQAPVIQNWLLSGGHVVTYPLPMPAGWVMNIVAIEETGDPAAADWQQPGDLTAFRRRFCGHTAELDALLMTVGAVRKWGLYTHPPLQAWHDDRVALLGDAAHPMLPFLAQGAAMAVEDAWVIAESLDRIDQVADALAAYQSARIARATAVQKASARAGRLYHMERPARFLRNLGMVAMSRVAAHRVTSRMDWIYGWDVTQNVVGEPTAFRV